MISMDYDKNNITTEDEDEEDVVKECHPELSKENTDFIKIMIDSFEAEKKLQEALIDAKNQRSKVASLESDIVKLCEKNIKLSEDFTADRKKLFEKFKEENSKIRKRAETASRNLRRYRNKELKNCTGKEIFVNSSSSNIVAVNAVPVHDDNNDQEKDNNKRKINDDESSSSSKKMKVEVKVDDNLHKLLKKRDEEIEQLKKQVEDYKNKIRVSFFSIIRIYKGSFNTNTFLKTETHIRSRRFEG